MPARAGRLGRLFLLCAALLPARGAAAEPGAAATVAVLPAGPGSVRGLADEASLDVFTGQVTYEIPIALPAAAAGFAPHLALGYHGALGNGPVGVGWSLAVPSIARSLRHGVPRYDAADELELRGVGGGGRLVRIADGTYRMEGQGQRVRVTGNEAAGFVVDDGAGLRLFFGAQVRRQDAGRTATWMLESIEDLSGQRAGYAYATYDGEPYLRTITWGARGTLRVTLDYEPRPDVVRSFRTGFEVRVSRRLRRLCVAAHGEERQAYHLRYDDAHRLSRLHEVRMTGRGGAAALPATTLHYAARREAETFQLTNAQNWYIGGRGTLLVDLDGDGISDFLQMETGRAKRNLGGTFAAAESTRGLTMAAVAAGRLVDIDGDGTVELLYDYPGEGWRVRRLVEGTWQSAGAWPGTLHLALAGEGTLLADVNGDGLPDHVRRLDGRMQVRFGTREGLGEPVSVPLLPTRNAAPSRPTSRWIDVNGDGLVDVWALGDADAHLYLGRGDGTFLDAGHFAYPWRGPMQQSPERMQFADLDRDGLADLVVTSHGHVTWYPGLPGGGWDAARTLQSPTDGAAAAIGDVNGNGSQDVVWASGWAADLAGPTTAGMLTAVDNGLGQTTRFSYRSSAELSQAAERGGAPWSRRLSSAIPVCVRIDHEVAGSATRTLLLDVQDGAWDADERRFAGFLVARTTTPAGGGAAAQQELTEETRFHEGTGTCRVLRGRRALVTRYVRAGRPLTRVETTWAAQPVAALAGEASPLLRLPLSHGTRTTVYAEDGASVTTATECAYDGEGNEARFLRMGRVDVEGDEAEERRSYAADDARWVRGVVVAAQSLDGAGKVLTYTRYAYDGGAQPLPHGRVSAGRLRRVEGYFAEEGRWVVRAEKDYDGAGNVVRSRDEGRERTFAYDADGQHPVREALRTGAATELVWTLAWDRVLGVPDRLTHPDGAIERAGYDALGRVVSLARGGAAPHVEYAYAWGAPHPRTTTRLHDGAAGERERVDVSDGGGRPVLSAWRLGAQRWQVEGHTVYDGRGQVRQAALPYYAAGLDDASLGAAPAAWRRFSYDALGRTVREERPDGTARSVAYRLLDETASSDGLAPVIYRRDGLGRTVCTQRDVGDIRERTEASYDCVGHLTELRLAGGAAVHTYHYDTLGRLVASWDPDSGARRHRYNDWGWPTARENDAGDSVRFAYDGAGRVTHREGGGARHVYHYDLPRDGSDAHTAARLAWVEDPSGETRFSYDAAGAPTRVVRRIRGETASREMAYSPAGLLLQSQSDDGVVLSYAYDAAGRPARVGELWSATKYGPAGGLLEERFGNGVTQAFVRSALDQPTQVDIRAGDAVLLTAAATYTPFGALASVTDADRVGRDHTARYTYDGAARLSGAELAGFTFTYAYDALNSLVRRDVEGPRALPMLGGPYAHGPPSDSPAGAPAVGPRQLAAVGGMHFAYDRAGRMIRAGARQMAYDAFDRMVGATLADGSQLAYTYGYDGEAAIAEGPDGVTYRFFPTLEQHDGVRRHRVMVGARAVARIDVARGGRDAGPQQVTYLHGGLGQGATLVTDPSGRVLDERQFEPFGAPIAADFAAEPRASADKPRDAATGWVDHGARWLAPELAQWLAPDPPIGALTGEVMAAPWDAHPYAHVRHSPLLYADPDGRHPVVAAVAIGSAAGGIISAGLEALRESVSAAELSARDIGAAAVGGAVATGTATVTAGSSLLVTAGAAGASGAISGVAQGYIKGEAISANSLATGVVTDAAIEAASFGLGKLVPILRAAWGHVLASPARSAQNIALHQRYLATLRANMEAPKVSDPKLQKIVYHLFKRGSEVGNGSSMAAVRLERLTGEKVKGYFHTEKCENAARGLEKWLTQKDKRDASQADRQAAENLLMDIRDALGS